MTIQAQLADGRILEFPDGTDPQVIQATVQGMVQEAGTSAIGAADALAGIASQGIGSALGGLAGSFASGSPLLDVTTQEGEQISEDIAGADIFSIFPITEQGKKTVRAIGENETLKRITDFLNSAGDIAGDFNFDVMDPIGKALGIDNLGAIFATAGKLTPDILLDALGGGAVALGTRGVTKGAKAAAQAIPSVDEAVTAGKELVTTAKDAFQFETAANKRITEQLQAGSSDIDVAKFDLVPSPLKDGGKPIIDEAFKEALKQGFDEGALSAAKASSPIDKKKAIKMIDIAERAKKNFKFGKTNRASDVLGDSLRNRFEVVTRANKAAGKEIGREAKLLEGRPIDLTEATGDFAQSLDELGVALVRDKNGNLKADFTNSDVGPGSRAPLNEVIRVMNLKSKGGIDGLKAHQMKKIIDEQVTFGKVKTGIGGQMEKALKRFRTGLDDALDSTFPAYNDANVQYAETITALDAFQDVAGKIDLFGDNADKALGQLMRRVSGNAASRIRLLDATNELTDIARKYENFGVGQKRIGKETTILDDDLIDQVIIVDELERQFGAAGTTSFQGQIQQAVEQAGRAVVTPKSGIADIAIKGVASVAENIRGIDDAAAFKALKELLRGN